MLPCLVAVGRERAVPLAPTRSEVHARARRPPISVVPDATTSVEAARAPFSPLL